MKTDREIAVDNSGVYHLSEIGSVSVLSRACRNLKNKRSFLFLSGVYDTLNNFHIVDVERADSVTVLVSVVKHHFASN